MLNWLKELDRILRGEATRSAALRRGEVEVLEQELAVGILVLGAIYGACMGCFALTSRDEPEFRQLLSTILKVPTLFLLTFLVTCPSLYVFNALVGSRLTLLAMFRLFVASASVLLAVLASLGPIIAFFSLTTTNYSFIILLNVAAFAVSGILGLGFLLQTLHRLSAIQSEEPREVRVAPVEESPSTDEPPLVWTPPPAASRPPVALVGPRVKTIFYIWVVVFALVGAQMSWVLRPFVGDPKQPFVVFRHRETSHVFHGIWRAVVALFNESESDRP